MNLNFKNWIESIEANKSGIKDTIINFLKDALNINDEEAILSMKLSSMDNEIINDLMRRGIVASSDENILSDIKNGSITVSELIDKLASDGSSSQQLNFNLFRKS
jgi:hypothetical protein